MFISLYKILKQSCWEWLLLYIINEKNDLIQKIILKYRENDESKKKNGSYKYKVLIFIHTTTTASEYEY